MAQNGPWREGSEGREWDETLARLGGHPLQSALWGNARRRVDGIPQLLLASRNAQGRVEGLARVETRRVPLLGRVAWLPRGPTLDDINDASLLAALRDDLRRRGFIACVTDLYAEASEAQDGKRPCTSWIDLTVGLDVLSQRLDPQWRYGVRRAQREGVAVRTSHAAVDVATFCALYRALSEAKGFAPVGSEALMQELVGASAPDGEVAMRLYLGEVGGRIASGALVARSGCHLHYMWGASDRTLAKYRASEAVQWRIIEDGVAAGMVRYDLEGIAARDNAGVAGFKRKMGGRILALTGPEADSLSRIGSIAVLLGRRLGRLP